MCEVLNTVTISDFTEWKRFEINDVLRPGRIYKKEDFYLNFFKSIISKPVSE